jgi:hypothetical protein
VSLDFLPEWQSHETVSWRAWIARALSAALHLGGILLLVFTPLGHGPARNMTLVWTQFKEPIILVAPPRELTQTRPNRGKIGKEFDLESLQPRPRVLVPPAFGPGAPTAGAPPSLPEPPRLDVAQTEVPSAFRQAPGPVVAPPPQKIQVDEKPKLVAPNSSIAEMGRDLARGKGMGGTVVTDLPPGLGGLNGGLSSEPVPGTVGSSLRSFPKAPGWAAAAGR